MVDILKEVVSFSICFPWSFLRVSTNISVQRFMYILLLGYLRNDSSIFVCSSGEAVEKNFVCDFKVDCFDGSDESNCSEYSAVLYHVFCNSLISRILVRTS